MSIGIQRMPSYHQLSCREASRENFLENAGPTTLLPRTYTAPSQL